MRKRLIRDEWIARIFNLSEAGVKFRSGWRIAIGGAVWLALSGMTMILTVFGVTSRLQIAILIALSFLKYIPLLWVVYHLGRATAANYINDVFELDNPELAQDFLKAVTFGKTSSAEEEDEEEDEDEDEYKKKNKDKVTINAGKISARDEKTSTILIGGPGRIQVNLDSVALLEKINGEPQVIYPRKEPWVLDHFERIREIGKSDKAGEREYAILNLKDQFIGGLSVKARTKDGIPLEAQGIKVMFSVLRSPQAAVESEREHEAAYLFDEEAVRALVYGQTVISPEPSGQNAAIFPWNTSVVPLIASEIERLITSRTLSEILATTSQHEADQTAHNEATLAKIRLDMTGKQDAVKNQNVSAPNFQSRSKITAQFFEEPFVTKAKKLGVSISWIDLGAWQPSSPTILNKYKDALKLRQDNAEQRKRVEGSQNSYVTKEVINLIDDVVIANFEDANSSVSRNAWNRDQDYKRDRHKQYRLLLMQNPELRIEEGASEEEIEETLEIFKPEAHTPIPQAGVKNDAANLAREILKAFRIELINSKELIKKEARHESAKQADLAKIDKALYEIEHLTYHFLK